MGNTTDFLSSMLIIFSIGIAYSIYRDFQKNKRTIKSKKPSQLKNIKLYTEVGDLIESFDEVYMVHWDTNIYLIYEEEDGKLITRIDKGENMLLTATNVVTAE